MKLYFCREAVCVAAKLNFAVKLSVAVKLLSRSCVGCRCEAEYIAVKLNVP